MAYLFIALLSILISLSVLGNILVISSAIFNKKLRKKTHILIINLAVSDLFISSFSLSLRLLGIIASTKMIFFPHQSSEMFCRYTICLTISLFAVSNFNLLLMTIDRYFAINHALYYKLIIKRRHIYLQIAASWVIAMTLGMLPAMVKDIRRVESTAEKNLTCTYASVTNEDYTTFITIFTFFLPLFAMIALYVKIIRKVRNTHLSYDFSNSRQPQIRTSLTPAVIKRRERRLSMGILTLLGAHTVLLAPISVLDLVQVFSRVSIPALPLEIALFLTYLNPVVNAPIYAAASKEYYQTFTNLLCCSGHWRRARGCCVKSRPARMDQPSSCNQLVRVQREKDIWYIKVAARTSCE